MAPVCVTAGEPNGPAAARLRVMRSVEEPGPRDRCSAWSSRSYDVEAYLPAASTACSPRRIDARGRRRRRRLDRRLRRHRRGVRRAATPASASSTPPTAASAPPATRDVRHVHRRATGVRRLRRRASRPTRTRHGRRARRTGLGLRDRLDRALGRRPACTSRRGCGGCTSRRGGARSPSTPRSSATCSRGTSCSAGRSGTRPGCPGRRACATRTSRRPPGPTSRAGFDVLPEVVYHWRIRPTARRSPSSAPRSRDLRDRWATKRMALATRRRRTTADGDPSRGLPRPGARRRPAPLLRRDPGLLGRVVGPVGVGVARAVGRAVAGAQRAAAGAPADRLAGRAGPPRGRGRGDAVRRRPPRPVPPGPRRRLGPARRQRAGRPRRVPFVAVALRS